jgi:prevent-host-death family protein
MMLTSFPLRYPTARADPRGDNDQKSRVDQGVDSTDRLASYIANKESTEHVVNMHEAKSQLSKFVTRAQQRASVTIFTHGRPVAKLVPIKPQPVVGL